MALHGGLLTFDSENRYSNRSQIALGISSRLFLLLIFLAAVDPSHATVTLGDSQVLPSQLLLHEKVRPALDNLQTRGVMPYTCLEGCRCKTRHAGVREVDCSQTNLTKLPLNIDRMTTILDLSVNRISHLPSRAFAYLPHLEELKLGSNFLESLPQDVFYNLENLTILKLQENRFRRIPVEAFRHLRSLKHLHLNDNQIQNVPEDSFQNMTSLTTLWLSKNNLTSLPEEAVNRLNSLVDLSFAKNHIKEVPPFALSNLNQLHYLSLARNNIQDLPDYAFSNLTNLKKLFLHHNAIHSIGPMAFADLKLLNHLDLSENRLPDVPKAIEPLFNLEKLQLKSNNISFIRDLTFQKSTRLIELELKGNPIRSFGYQAFSKIPMLERLVVSQADRQTVFPDLTGSHKLAIIQFDRAGIETLPTDLCQKVPTLQSLDVHSNKITKMPNLTGCGELRILNLCNNKITELQFESFRGLSKLRDLIMGNNFITKIPDGAFTGLERLENLDLVDNKISYIAENAFKPLNNLRELNLGENQFSHLPTDGLIKLKKLLIYKNKYLQNFPSSSAFPEIQFLTLTYSYHCCKFIQTTEPAKEKSLEFTEEILWLRAEDADWDHFENITEIWKPIVNGSIRHYDMAIDILDGNFNSEFDYNMGELPPATVEHLEDYIRPDSEDIVASRSPVMCQPMPDPFLPCDDLFGWWYLRCGVWVVLQLALLGNSVVLFVSITSKSKMDVQRFLICNLATADLFMGIYLAFLAVVDAGTLGEFKKFALDWQTSPWCLVAGIMGTVSSEMSVYTLTIITLERFYVITHTMQLDKRLSLTRAGYIMLAGWIFTITLASMPLFGISNYQKFAICLPFETGDLLSLVYVCFIMIFNGTSFLVIMSCYLKMYCDIRDSQAWNSPDVRVAKRMSLLIFTDFLCWMPITILSLTAVFGKELISLEEAKFFTIFVLPLNSCANPFLYAIFTKQFKRDCANFCRRLEDSTINQSYGRQSNNRHQLISWGSGRLASLMKLFWVEKRPDSDRAASSKCSLNPKDNSYESLTKKCFCPVCEECLKLQLANDDKLPEECLPTIKQVTADIVLTGRKSDSDYKNSPDAAVTNGASSGSCSTEDDRLLNKVHLFQPPCPRSDEPGTVLIPLEILHTSNEIPTTSRVIYEDYLPPGICSGNGCGAITNEASGPTSTGSCNNININYGTSNTSNNGNCSSTPEISTETQYLSLCSNTNGSNYNNSSVLISNTGYPNACQTRLLTIFREPKTQRRSMNNDNYKVNTRRGCPQSCHHTVYSPKWAPAHQRLKSKSGLSIVPEEEKPENIIPKVKITEASDTDVSLDASSSGSPVSVPKMILSQRPDGYRLLSTTADISCPGAANGTQDQIAALSAANKPCAIEEREAEGSEIKPEATVEILENGDHIDDHVNNESRNQYQLDTVDSDPEDTKTGPSSSVLTSPRFRVNCSQRSLSMSTLKDNNTKGLSCRRKTLLPLRPYHSAETVKVEKMPRPSSSSLSVPSKVTRRIPSHGVSSLTRSPPRQLND